MEINRKVLTIDNMDKIINQFTFSRKYKILEISQQMKELCEINSDFNCASAWNVEELIVNPELKEKEFNLR